VLVGGIGLPWRRDLDLGRMLIGDLAEASWPAGVVVEDLSYSAHRIMHTLEALRPERLVLVAATVREGEEAGAVRRYRPDDGDVDPDDLIARLGESVGGVIDLDHTLVVNRHFGTLPADTVVIEIVTGDDAFGVGYSAEVDAALPAVMQMVREEVLRD
jgi:hydrogenase maturation protease